MPRLRELYCYSLSLGYKTSGLVPTLSCDRCGRKEGIPKYPDYHYPLGRPCPGETILTNPKPAVADV